MLTCRDLFPPRTFGHKMQQPERVLMHHFCSRSFVLNEITFLPVVTVLVENDES